MKKFNTLLKKQCIFFNILLLVSGAAAQNALPNYRLLKEADIREFVDPFVSGRYCDIDDNSICTLDLGGVGDLDLKVLVCKSGRTTRFLSGKFYLQLSDKATEYGSSLPDIQWLIDRGSRGVIKPAPAFFLDEDADLNFHVYPISRGMLDRISKSRETLLAHRGVKAELKPVHKKLIYCWLQYIRYKKD